MSTRNNRLPSCPIAGVGAPCKDILVLLHDRSRIDALAEALNISRRNIGKDSCGTWSISGAYGRLQTFDALEFLLYVSARSSRKWSAIKRKAIALGFALTQDGDDEGCFRFSLPNEDAAKFLRQMLGLRRRKRPS